MTRRWDDDGTAVVEFVYLAVLLMIPLMYVMINAFDVQRSAFGVTEAARQAGRTWVGGCGSGDDKRDEAQLAARLALRDQGVAGYELSLPACPPPGGTAVVTVTHFVKLRGLGALVPVDRGGFDVTGRFVAARDRFRVG